MAAYQQRPDAGVRLTNGACDVPDLRGNPTHELPQPMPRAAHAERPRGLLRAERSRGGIAFALLDGTLVRLEQIDMLAERDVLAYFDALQPVDADELEFKRG